MNKNVIISVYDKTDLDMIAKFLIKKNLPYTHRNLILKNNIPHIEILNIQNKKKY